MADNKNIDDWEDVPLEQDDWQDVPKSIKVAEQIATPVEQPNEVIEDIKTATGTGLGTAAGYAAGKAVATPIEKKALDAIAANMGFGKQLSEELGDVEKRRLAKKAVDLDIFKALGDAEQQKADVASQLSSLGKQQSELYKQVSPEAKQIELKDLLEQFKKQAAPSLSVDRSEMTAFRQATKDLENLTSPASPEKSLQKLGLEDLQELKKKYGELAYKEGKSLVGSTDKASMASKGNKVTREAIEKLISDIPESGQVSLSKLKEINKLYSDLSKIEPGIAKQAGKEAANAGKLLPELKSMFVDTGVKGALKAGAKASKGIPVVGALLGGTLGAAAGALAAEEGKAAEEAGKGFVEGANPLDIAFGSLASGEMPRDPQARAAIQKEFEQTQEIRRMPVEQKSQVVEALKGKLDYTPTQLNQVSERMLSIPGAESFAEVLRNVVDKPERTRKSVLFGLLQQPSFREALKKIENE